MNVSSELGISPFLLQAISQKISSKDNQHTTMDPPFIKQDPAFIKQEIIENHEDSSQEEVTNALLNPDMAQLLPEIVNTVQQRLSAEGIQRPITADDIRQIITLKLAQQAQQNLELQTFTATQDQSTDNNMIGFLSPSKTSTDVGPTITATEIPVRTYEGESSTQSPTTLPDQLYMCYNQVSTNSTVPSPSNDIVVSDSIQMTNVVIDQSGQRYVVHSSDSNQTKSSDSLIRQAQYNDKGELVIGDLPLVSTTEKAEGQPGVGVSIVPPAPVTEPCPVCGDQVSGYHYGIFTCESCKGFFKRTVQNKKVFQCHRSSDCDVMRNNRKKCPACRFSKCLQAGMKIEAVRLDRTRGGRSCYDGCSPHGRPNKTFLDKKMTPKPKKASPQPDYLKQLQSMELKLPSGDTVSGSRLFEVIQKSSIKPTVTPVVPPVLSDIMSMESLLTEDENSTEMPDKIGEGDQNFFLSFLQIAEVRLYKLVRWARNLPQFSAISTDDQILLLQNSWAELLIFNCCMKSIESRTEIFLPLGKTVNLEKARNIGEGCEDIVQRMLDLTDQLRRLHVDQYEYVAMKVLILITPDVKGMKESQRAREQQEIISDALYQYTSSHYPNSPDKYGEMLLRLPEITRVSGIGKELLNNLMPPGFQSCGLLFELLKGDGATKEDS